MHSLFSSKYNIEKHKKDTEMQINEFISMKFVIT